VFKLGTRRSVSALANYFCLLTIVYIETMKLDPYIHIGTIFFATGKHSLYTLYCKAIKSYKKSSFKIENLVPLIGIYYLVLITAMLWNGKANKFPFFAPCYSFYFHIICYIHIENFKNIWTNVYIF